MSLGWGGETWDDSDSPRPGERPEDVSQSDTFRTRGKRPVRTPEEEAEANRLAAELRAHYAKRGGGER